MAGDSIRVKLSEATKLMLASLPFLFKKGTVTAMKLAMKDVEENVKNQFGKAGSIKVRTGHLKRSINTKVVKEGNKVIGSIGSDVIYAAIHEFGGTIKPTAGDYLKFQGDSGFVSVKSVVIPERPYFRPAIKRSAPSIKKILYKSINEEMLGHGRYK